MNSPPDRRRAAIAAAGLAALVATLPALALILTGHNAGRGAWDSIVYHEPFIRQLAADWPRFDLSDPLTATTPGYHLLLATVAAAGADSETALRLISALIGAALAALVAAWCARRTTALDAVLLALPLACSIYLLSSSAWLLPDNLAWIGVSLVLMLTLADRRPSSRNLPSRATIAAAAVLIPLVFTRQIHLWAAGVVWLAAWLGPDRSDPPDPPGRPFRLFDQIPTRLSRTAAALALTVPAFLVVAWFVRHWGGLTPPRFQSDITGVNPATPAFILVQIAVLTIGFGPWLAPALLRALRHRPLIPLAGAGLGLLLALAPPTTYAPDLGRYSGWWSLAQAAPVLFGRTSATFLLLAPVGGVVLAGALSGAPRRTAWLMLGALTAFAVAQSATINSWQRYHEPFLLILLAMLAAAQDPELRTTPFVRLRPVGMGLLCAALAAITVLGLRGDPVRRGTLPPARHTSPSDPWAAQHASPEHPAEPALDTRVPPIPGEAPAPPGR